MKGAAEHEAVLGRVVGRGLAAGGFEAEREARGELRPRAGAPRALPLAGEPEPRVKESPPRPRAGPSARNRPPRRAGRAARTRRSPRGPRVAERPQALHRARCVAPGRSEGHREPAPRRRGVDAHRPARPPLLVPRRLVEVNTTSDSPTASAMELTPTSTQRWTAAASRSWTRISCPLFLRHMEPPMFPAPMNPTFIWGPPVLRLSAARPSQGSARGSPRGMDARASRASGRIRDQRVGAAPSPGAAPTAAVLPAHGGAEGEGVHRPFVAAGRPGAACLEAEGRGGGEPPPGPGAKGAARTLPHRDGCIGRHHAGA